MRKLQKNRYSSAKALEKDLSSYIQNKPIEAKPYSFLDQIIKFVISNKTFCAIFATVILLLLSWVYIIYQKSNYHEQQSINLKKIELEKKELQKLTNTLFDALNYMTKQHAEVFSDPNFSSKMVDVFKQNLNVELEQDRIITIRGIVLSSSEDEKDLEQAVQDLTYYLEKNPSSADRYNSRGMVYRKLKQYDKALADYEKAIEIMPRHTYYFNRGVIYDVLKNYERALGDYNKAISLNPRYFIAVASRALVHERMEKYDIAIQDYTYALKLTVPKGLNSQQIKKELLEHIQKLKEKSK